MAPSDAAHDARRAIAPVERGPPVDAADVIPDAPWRRGPARSSAPSVHLGARVPARFGRENWRILTVLHPDGRVEYLARVRA